MFTRLSRHNCPGDQCQWNSFSVFKKASHPDCTFLALINIVIFFETVYLPPQKMNYETRFWIFRCVSDLWKYCNSYFLVGKTRRTFCEPGPFSDLLFYLNHTLVHYGYLLSLFEPKWFSWVPVKQQKITYIIIYLIRSLDKCTLF